MKEVPKSLPFENYKSDWLKSNQHILWAHMHIYIKDEVCMTIYRELSIDKKPKKSTKMSVTYEL